MVRSPQEGQTGRENTGNSIFTTEQSQIKRNRLPRPLGASNSSHAHELATARLGSGGVGGRRLRLLSAAMKAMKTAFALTRARAVAKACWSARDRLAYFLRDRDQFDIPSDQWPAETTQLAVDNLEFRWPTPFQCDGEERCIRRGRINHRSIRPLPPGLTRRSTTPCARGGRLPEAWVTVDSEMSVSDLRTAC